MKPIQRLALYYVFACAPLGIAHAQTVSVLVGPAGALAPSDTKYTACDSAVRQVDVNYRAVRDRCDAIKGNDHDVCRAQAKGDYSVTKASAMVEHDGTETVHSRTTREEAETGCNVVKTKCDAMKDNDGDTCVKDARVAYTRARGGGEVSHTKATDTAKDISEACRDAVKDTDDAGYKVAEERRDAMSDDAKTKCQNDVTTRLKK